MASVAWNVLAVSVGAMALLLLHAESRDRRTRGRQFLLIPGTVALLGWALLVKPHSTAALGFAVASVGVFPGGAASA